MISDVTKDNIHGVTRMNTTETDRTAVLAAAADGDATTGAEQESTQGLKKYRMIQPAAFYFTVLASNERDAFAQAAEFANRLSPWGLTQDNWPEDEDIDFDVLPILGEDPQVDDGWVDEG